MTAQQLGDAPVLAGDHEIGAIVDCRDPAQPVEPGFAALVSTLTEDRTPESLAGCTIYE